MIGLLTWFTSKKDYLTPYTEDEAAKKAATKLWNTIDSMDIILFIVMFMLTILIALWYYFPYNQRPGKHYHPKYWWIFGVGAVSFVFASTFGICYFIAKNASFDYTFLIKVSAVNALYAILVYFILSLFINKSGKSNAYPYIRF